jgi:hypothetical protein
VRKRRRRIDHRLAPRAWKEQPAPMLAGRNIHYEVADKTRAIGCGGIGAMHSLVQRVGLAHELDSGLDLLQRHVPYHESDHVLTVAYNVLCGGQRLEDIDRLRQDEAWLDAVGAQSVPDPTTAGDFTRRFEAADIEALMACLNRVRTRVWRERQRTTPGFLQDAIIDVDGTTAPTLGECKHGIGLSYQGIWGYGPLLVSLANTGEPLYLANRPANVASHQDAAPYIDQAIALVAPFAKRICLRGDTDFALTAHFDRWAQQADFVFGLDAQPHLVRLAEAVPETAWQALPRPPKYQVATTRRQRGERVKAAIVRERGYKNVRLCSEQVTEFSYRPGQCQRDYRVVVVRKNLSTERGETVLFEEFRYFFYITTRTDLTAAQLVAFINGRGDQENVIAQLKGGVHALAMPVHDLLSNWAYMVMAALAWSLKAWFALLMPEPAQGATVLRMEFRRFVQGFIQVPCQIVRGGGRIVYRVLGYNRWLGDLLATHTRVCGLGQRLRGGPVRRAPRWAAT